jgi:hypothetical protein
MLLLVQSALCGVQSTIDHLRSEGLKAAVSRGVRKSSVR